MQQNYQPVTTRERIADYALAVSIGIALAIGALAYFDVLFC